jgi:hypothetical protein
MPRPHRSADRRQIASDAHQAPRSTPYRAKDRYGQAVDRPELQSRRCVVPPHPHPPAQASQVTGQLAGGGGRHCYRVVSARAADKELIPYRAVTPAAVGCAARGWPRGG